MTPNQIKKIAQDLFIKQGEQFGKRCFIHRFIDNSDLMNRGNRGYASLPRSPSDYLVTINGQMFFAEVKGTELNKFSTSRIEPSQWGAISQSHAAGGNYLVFVYYLPTKKWEIFTQDLLVRCSVNSIKSLNLEGSLDDWTAAFS